MSDEESNQHLISKEVGYEEDRNVDWVQLIRITCETSNVFFFHFLVERISVREVVKVDLEFLEEQVLARLDLVFVHYPDPVDHHLVLLQLKFVLVTFLYI